MPSETSVKATLNPTGGFTSGFSSGFDKFRIADIYATASMKVNSSVKAKLLK